MNASAIVVDGTPVAVDDATWPVIASANRTKRTEFGYVTLRLMARRHADGQVLVFVEREAGDRCEARGELLTSPSNEQIIATADRLPGREELYQESIEHFSRALTR